MVYKSSLPISSFLPSYILPALLGIAICFTQCSSPRPAATKSNVAARERISINEGWRFIRDTSASDNLMYDVRPEVTDRNDNIIADTKPTESIAVSSSENALKHWILPAANEFVKDPARHHKRPAGNPGSTYPYVQSNFDDNSWEQVRLPHDWAIKGPFYRGNNVPVGGGMGRLPIHGVGWYRKKLNLPASDSNRKIYLDIDGAMSYAMVWLNGNLVGGWPFGYNSFRVDLTPYIQFGSDNQLAIRLDNPTNSSRWYPGAGLYRNVWLTKANPIHVANWGTHMSTNAVSAASATLSLNVKVQNNSATSQAVQVVTNVFALDDKLNRGNSPVATFPAATISLPAHNSATVAGTTTLQNPKLWGPPPTQQPHQYIAVTRVMLNGTLLDEYETPFGIRTITFHPDKGLLVNGEAILMKGVNQHHDLGALGAAFNVRAAERQLEILKEMGCNAIRLAHNPPAPELLELTDRMGFLVIDEIFDIWERKKTPLDFHLIFPDWYEADTRAFVRRDRNHPSVIAWSFGNEVGEQYTAEAGSALAKKLYDIVKEEDSTRPASASMNYAKPNMPFPAVMDFMSLNYQGEGIRDAPAYSHLTGIRTSPLYPAFRQQFPGKMIVSSETSSALSTRGTYVFPVTNGNSAPVSDSTGGNPKASAVSAYELYTAQFGSSPDKVFASQDKHPYVAGEFVWSGWDYLGEPTPYYNARSSYSGIIDLAGFKKDRFYLYQSRWRPTLPIAHILPHWNWPDRVGQVTPVHVFTSGDEAELFLNNTSLGRKKKEPYTYRLRWDEVKYEPGELKVVAYKQGKPWAEEKVQTTGSPTQCIVTADRSTIAADGDDLSFITIRIADAKGNTVPDANNRVTISVQGDGELVATDNGDPADLLSFASASRQAYSGMLLAIVRSKKSKPGNITITCTADGLKTGTVRVRSE